jgi:hypothetical protein
MIQISKFSWQAEAPATPRTTTWGRRFRLPTLQEWV